MNRSHDTLSEKNPHTLRHKIQVKNSSHNLTWLVLIVLKVPAQTCQVVTFAKPVAL